MSTGSKNPNTQFKKGKSGNPGGMTSEVAKGVREMRAKALTHCPDALQKLVEALGSNDEKVRIQAANSILDRGLGKPAQAIEHSGQIGRLDVRELTEAELEHIAAG